MYAPNANRITFNLDETYGGNKNAMYQDIAKVLKILVDNNEICTFEYEDCGYYCLQHNYAKLEYGDVYPMWLTEEEQDIINEYRSRDKNSQIDE